MSIIQSLLGQQGGFPRLVNRTVQPNANNFYNLDFGSDGRIRTTIPGTTGTDGIYPLGEWWSEGLAPLGVPDQYEIRVTILSGNGGSISGVGAWLNLGVGRFYGRFGWTGVARAEIRPAGGTTILASADYTMG